MSPSVLAPIGNSPPGQARTSLHKSVAQRWGVVRRCWSCASAAEEVAHCGRNFRGVGLQREMSGIKKAHDRTGVFSFERLGTHREDERVVLAPHRQETRVAGAEIFLESWIERDIALVIAKQVELQLIGTGTG